MIKTIFEEFMSMKLDTRTIGLDKSDCEDYFCVPIGAKVFAGLGVDGVQFCFIDGFNEMVFAISPEAIENKFVNPIAENFEIFLRLVVSCKNANPLEQIYWNTREEFISFLEEDMKNASAEQTAVLGQLQSELNISPMTDPYAYVKELQRGFDYSRIKYSDEFYDVTGLPQ